MSIWNRFPPLAESTLGMAYFCARRFDAAMEHIERNLETFPGHATNLVLLALAYAAARQPEKAIEKCQEALAVGGRAAIVRLHAAATYAKAGKTEEARRILEDAETHWKPDGTSSCWIASVYACLGEKDAAFDWLERAFNERASFMVFLKTHPLFVDLHGDPRFDDLVKRIGIPD